MDFCICRLAEGCDDYPVELEPGGYKGRPRAVVDAHRCRGCGRCAAVCPVGAIELTYPGRPGVEATIGRIGPLVDLQ